MITPGASHARSPRLGQGWSLTLLLLAGCTGSDLGQPNPDLSLPASYPVADGAGDASLGEVVLDPMLRELDRTLLSVTVSGIQGKESTPKATFEQAEAALLTINSK